jgi:hypothetical protein
MPASNRPFMGATAFDTGVTFRVWAPFAGSVNVAGISTLGRRSLTSFFQKGGVTGLSTSPGPEADRKLILVGDSSPAACHWFKRCGDGFGMILGP